MKKILAMLLFVSAGLFCLNCKNPGPGSEGSSEVAGGVVIPDEVMAVIDVSCYGCHNSESQNEKAREKISFDKLDASKAFVLIGIMEEIRKEVESGKMPPEKFLANYPDRALTDENSEILLKWAAETAEKVAGK